jgi:hypothetical protein
MGKRATGLALLSTRIKARSFCNLSTAHKRELAGLKKEFSSIEELIALRVDNLDLGYAVLSSLVSETRDSHPDLRAHAGVIKNLLISAFAVYRSIQAYLEQHPVDKMYVFNGRFACVRGALRACQSRNVDCFTHDRGHDFYHYDLTKNTMPHDRVYIEQSVREQWARAADNPDREKIAAQFYLDRANKVGQSWYSLIEGQQDGLLPSNWDLKKKNIAIYSSSEDEFAAIGDEWINPLYENQLTGLKRIIHSLSDDCDKVHLYIRMHPNLQGVQNEHTRELHSLRSDLVTVIAPEDKVSTYALVKAATTVLTFGSTVGIEAVFWGTPSVLAGQAFYRNLGGTYNPRSHEELVELLKADLLPKDREAALMYGYYLNTFGTPFKYFKAQGVFEGEFKGRKVEPAKWAKRMIRALWMHWRVRSYLLKIALFWARKRLTGQFSGGE